MKKTFIIGVLYLLSLTILAMAINNWTNNVLGEVVIALLLGIIAANTMPFTNRWEKAITYGEKKVLGWAIGLMGLQLSFVQVQSMLWLIPVLIIMIILSLYLGEKLAVAFGCGDKCGMLIGAGNAICGSSAIAAISPVIKSEPYETGVSISVIQILGTVGMLAIPALASVIPLEDDTVWGVLSGGTLQAVGQAIAGGFAVSESAGETATVLKMTRVLMLLPVVLYFSFRFRDKSDAGRKLKFPSFILVFVALMVVSNVVDLHEDIRNYASGAQDFLLTYAMVSIGNKIHYKDLMVKGVKALKLGSFIFLIQLALFILVLLGKHFLIEA